MKLRTIQAATATSGEDDHGDGKADERSLADDAVIGLKVVDRIDPVPDDEAAEGGERPERHDQRIDAGAGDDRAVQRAADEADADRNREARMTLKIVGSFWANCPDKMPATRKQRADGEIDARGNDRERHSDRDDADHRHLQQDKRALSHVRNSGTRNEK